MSTRPNLFEPEFDAGSDRNGFAYRRARLGRQADGERLGASLYELPTGQAAYPYPWHSAKEELLFVIAGTPSLRTPAGWRDLEPGEVVAFNTGDGGAHQLVNRSDAPVRFLMISEMNAPEVCVYPDSNKVMAMQRAPGSIGDEEAIAAWFRLGDEVDYWQGEEPPPEAGN
jgi:uncharacterized cupin superfamily protein